MGKPRMIILIRHAQSEGNKNRDIHQFIPDHRVKLTEEGQKQALEAGTRLRSLLRPDDTIQFYTSPYRRTRETTEGILTALTSDDPTPSPWKRSMIKLYEEPRLREQDFGNFQPCSAEMERMWQERADYGHFFYRIPNGESAADAYDRVSGFNESLWRQFQSEDFASVTVLVTHGLMTRVFLMKWYHWSVEYFEDLRNVNHCEFIIMKQNKSNGKYTLQNQLRTWSDLKRRAAATQAMQIPASTHAHSRPNPLTAVSTANAPARKWGGCANGCRHAQIDFPRRTKRANTQDNLGSTTLEKAAQEIPQDEKEDNPMAQDPAKALQAPTGKPAAIHTPSTASETIVESPTSHSHSASGDGDVSNTSASEEEENPSALHPRIHGRDAGGSLSGAASPAEGFSDDSDFPIRPKPCAMSKPRSGSKQREGRFAPPKRQMSQAEWEEASGMTRGVKAEPLGDGEPCGCESAVEAEEKFQERQIGGEKGVRDGGIVHGVVEGIKDKARKTFDEVY